MPINFLPIAGAAIGTLQQTKIEKASAGIKTYTKPKTILGKIIGGVSGRNQAAEVSDMNKTSPLSEKVINSLQPQRVGGIPLTGGISFGGEAGKKTFFPFAVVAAVVAIFYFMRRRKGGRRRY